MEKGDRAASAEIGGVKSAQRTLHLLSVLADASKPIPVLELQRLTKYPRSSLHQLLRTMAVDGWVTMATEGTSVSIGSRALVVGASYLDHDAALPWVVFQLEQLRSLTGCSARYERLIGADIVLLDSREIPDHVHAAAGSGRVFPAHATAAGKSLLAERTEADRALILGSDALTAVTPFTTVDRSALEQQLDRARAEGFAVEREESVIGLSHVSAVVRYRVPEIDAISCSLPVADASDNEILRVANAVRRSAEELESILRKQDPR